MTTATIRLKVELRYEPEHGSHEEAAEYVERMLNHPNDDVVLDVRVAPGHSAGAVFLTLTPGRRQERELSSIAAAAVMWLDGKYAADVASPHWAAEAVEVDRDE